MAKTYVDGFVIVIPKKNRKMYLKMAKDGAKTWKRFGAIDYKECRMDDMKPSHVKLTFAKLTKAKPSEEVWFSYVVYKSKADRNRINKAVMAYYDKKYAGMKDFPMPFKDDRFSTAGFVVEVD